MRRLIGLRDFVHDAIEKTTDLVEETHESAAHKPVRALSYFEPLGTAARGVDSVRKLTAKLVFDQIRATNRTVQAISDVGFTLATQVLEAAIPEREPSAKTLAVSAWIDRAESALNAVCGDFLEARDNGLSIKMSMRHDGRDLVLTPEALTRALPHANGKLCVFVHGLGCSDSIWRSDDPRGNALDFGGELDRDLGYTSLFVRYNTGLHISQNGRALALLLSQLEQAFPCAVTEIALVGHSMGGLVARSAAHYGRALDHGWSNKLTHLLCIGSPHFGTPLERAGNVVTSVLSFFDTAGTQVPAKVFNARSAGIKDLRFGSIVDEDWQGKDPDAFFTDTSNHAPFIDGVTYGYIAARFHAADHGLAELVGDMLVQIPSASGAHRDETRKLPFHMGTVLEGVHHVALTNHPAVYEQLKLFLSECRAGVVPSESEPA
jgi:triacylglycerol lipase